jgi:tetratricopeptide (TPR) repeat protein
MKTTTSRAATALLVAAGALASAPLAGCGSAARTTPQAKAAQAGPMAPANPQAVTRMVLGVQASKDIKQSDKAISLFKEAIGLDPQLWEARYNLGVVLAKSGDMAGAEEQLKAAAQLAPDDGDVISALAEVRRRRGQNKEAADILGEFLKNHASNEGRIIYVAALRDSGQVDRAIVQAREVLVRKPGDPAALAELALCHLAKGERDTASLLVKQAIEANPKNAVAERANGLIALSAGDDALAFGAFTNATREDPRDTTARLNIASVLLRAGSYSKAEEQYRAVLQITPDETTAMVGLAAALRGQGDTAHPHKFEEARSILDKTLERDPHDMSAEYNLGVLYADFLKRPIEGRAMFQRFLADAPSDHPARPSAEKYVSTLASMVKAAAPSAAPAPATPAAGSAPSTAPPPAPNKQAPPPPRPQGSAKGGAG